MWIESLSIEGFRSFGDKTVIHFHPGHNAIFGWNGSGKSNLLAALAFVLQGTPRADIFHKPSISQSATVKVTLDNHDRRMPVNLDKVKIVRVLGLKKDVLYLNGKPITKDELGNQLATAGVSKNNPYHFVRQGEINSLALATPLQRLNLLEDFAGLNTYADKRKASLTELKEATESLASLDDILEKMDEEIDGLATEAKELEAYNKLDKVKRAATYIMLSREVKPLQDKLALLRKRASKLEAEKAQFWLGLVEAKEAAKANRRRLKETRLTEATLRSELEMVREDHEKALCEGQRMVEAVDQLSTELRSLEANCKEAKKKVEGLKDRVDKRQEEVHLQDLEVKKYKVKAKGFEMKARATEAKLKSCYDRRARRGQFESEQERVEFLRAQVQQVDMEMHAESQTVQGVQLELDGHNLSLDKLGEAIIANTREVAELNSQQTSLTEELEQAKRSANGLKLERDVLFRTVLQLQQGDKREALASAHAKLRSKAYMRPLMEGAESVSKVLDHLQETQKDLWVIEGVHGQVGYMLDCEAKLHVALSVTMGNRLFNFVVSTAHVASRILYWMKKLHLPGEVHFMPLDKLMSTGHKMVRIENARPLLDLVTFPTGMEKVFEFLLGKTMLVRDESDFMVVKRRGYDAVTLEGVQASRKGCLTGGYYDHKLVKLSLMKDLNVKSLEVEAVEAEIGKAKSGLDELGVRLQKELERGEKTETKLERLASHLLEADSKQKERMMKAEKANLTFLIGEVEERLNGHKTVLAEMEQKKEALEKEMRQDSCTSSQQDVVEMEGLRKELKAIRSQWKKAFKDKNKVEARRNDMKNELETQLVPKLEETRQQADESIIKRTRQRLETATRQKQSLESSVKNLSDDLNRLDYKIEDAIAKHQSLYDVCEAASMCEQEAQEAYNNVVSEHLSHDKETDVQKRLEECLRKLQGVSTVPEEERQRFERMNNNEVAKCLKKVAKKLQLQTDVNYKAINLLQELTQKRSDIVKKRKKINAERMSVVHLLEQMEDLKQEKLLFTFKQMAKYFAEIFAVFVPEGKGRLTFDMGPAADSSPSSSGDNSSPSASREQLPVGLSVHVAFSSGEPMSELKQLSGGQKSVVALSFIFAIQKCDPSPFYIFDEIDANLDDKYRTTVADWIASRKSVEERRSSQFITATFHREMLEKADKFIGIRYGNNISYKVDIDSPQEAFQFIQADGQQVNHQD